MGTGVWGFVHSHAVGGEGHGEELRSSSDVTQLEFSVLHETVDAVDVTPGCLAPKCHMSGARAQIEGGV